MADRPAETAETAESPPTDDATDETKKRPVLPPMPVEKRPRARKAPRKVAARPAGTPANGSANHPAPVARRLHPTSDNDVQGAAPTPASGASTEPGPSFATMDTSKPNSNGIADHVGDEHVDVEYGPLGLRGSPADPRRPYWRRSLPKPGHRPPRHRTGWRPSPPCRHGHRRASSPVQPGVDARSPRLDPPGGPVGPDSS
jgi:hypothetical protein